jgi:hypothetical protein
MPSRWPGARSEAVDEEKLKRLRWPALGACLLKILLRLLMLTVVVVRGNREEALIAVIRVVWWLWLLR